MIGDLSTRLAGRTIWIEADVVTVAANEQLRGGGVETVAQSGLVERLRAIKEPEEIAAMREAAAISDRVFEALAEEQFTGRTERELAWRVRELFHEHGSSELAFDTIVAAAENGASPHADVRDAAIPANTLVTIDAGCRIDGYASDCTRTFATGELGRARRVRGLEANQVADVAPLVTSSGSSSSAGRRSSLLIAAPARTRGSR